MKIFVFIDHARFIVQPESHYIRNEDLYCAIKERVNQGANLKNTRTDWQNIRLDSEILAESKGVDLIIASYYTVAAFKTQGFKGLANGLKLINAALIHQESLDNRVQKLNGGLIEWVKKQVIRDTHLLDTNNEILRDLYRCEYECQVLDDILDRKKYAVECDFEDISMAIFTHIDKLEMRFHTLEKEKDSKVSLASKIISLTWNDTSLVIASSFISVFLTAIVMTYLPS